MLDRRLTLSMIFLALGSGNFGHGYHLGGVVRTEFKPNDETKITKMRYSVFQQLCHLGHARPTEFASGRAKFTPVMSASTLAAKPSEGPSPELSLII
jgi:hypothetical protein